jgi:hypothetical protein
MPCWMLSWTSWYLVSTWSWFSARLGDPGLALAALGHLVLGLLGVALGLGAVMG